MIHHMDHAPEPLNMDTWPRQQHFHHFRRVPCTYSMTFEIDVTAFVAALRQSPRKSYIAQVWALATIVNRHDEFKMCLTEEGTPAVWPVVHPAFTVFNPELETFAGVFAEYDPDFGAFHDVAAPLLAKHSQATEFVPQGFRPPNAFDISSIPWASFTAFNLNIDNDWDHLSPIFTLGRYIEREGRVRLPVAAQVHHAVADGFHVTRLINELETLVQDTSWL
ncbi:CatA-like O-acetyltransferase [Nonomuraea typhae]|uniref:CatA-like O-acetyltransferase n=1 Tax=Nonomuraea typhae TaxID=2603600 RepID=UPI0031B5D7EF